MENQTEKETAELEWRYCASLEACKDRSLWVVWESAYWGIAEGFDMQEHFSKNQLIQLVRKIVNSEGTEAEIDAWQLLLQRTVPDPAISDLMFFSDVELSPEEIVERALNYRPIPMPPEGSASATNDISKPSDST
jgi:hypothetical protein